MPGLEVALLEAERLGGDSRRRLEKLKAPDVEHRKTRQEPKLKLSATKQNNGQSVQNLTDRINPKSVDKLFC